jgi:hypothetical protein
MAYATFWFTPPGVYVLLVLCVLSPTQAQCLLGARCATMLTIAEDWCACLFRYATVLRLSLCLFNSTRVLLVAYCFQEDDIMFALGEQPYFRKLLQDGAKSTTKSSSIQYMNR